MNVELDFLKGRTRYQKTAHILPMCVARKIEKKVLKRPTLRTDYYV